ncbi:vitamin K epoxide reductase family protein [Mucilaginibacter sp.]|uniref:vitamin K epoxide reductase family protein n=1 Tax=Mucilaginibacter sp. TaxID=1882438 RepID=UPI0025EEE179|nr:vitamin K epoxide reductase family protein [Mucilaginibacter sp.]
MHLFKNYKNPDAVVVKLLERLLISTKPAQIVEELSTHPDYPSILAISDVLTSYNINNTCYKFDEGGFRNIEPPFIAQTSLNGGSFLLVDSITDDKVTASNEKWDKRHLKVEEFNRIFSGAVLTAETPKISITPVKKIKTTMEKLFSSLKPLLAILAALLILAVAVAHSAFLSHVTVQITTLVTIKVAGLFTSILLLAESINHNNQLIQKICQTGKKTDCNAILSSRAANVFSGLSWSEVGFFYFSSTLLVTLFESGSSLSWQTLVFSNWLSLPYTFYSIYHQLLIAKRWCVLCCIVQALLWCEFFTFTFFKFDNSIFTTPDRLDILFACLLLPIIFWGIIKPILQRVQEVPVLKRRLKVFQYSVEVFNSIMSAQPLCSMPDEKWSISLGNDEPGNVITIVTNPTCSSCRETHRQLENWLKRDVTLQARIIFKSDSNDHEIKTKLCNHLMAINEFSDKNIVMGALNSWYGNREKDYEGWSKQYPATISEAATSKLRLQNDWCTEMKIEHTPTVFLNGRLLPEIYKLSDLKYLL